MTTIKKKTAPKPPKPEAKYSVNQKVFIISYHKEVPEQLNEAKVWAVTSRKTAIFEWGKVVGSKLEFSYVLTLPDGSAQSADEPCVYPSYPSAAQVFAKSFLVLLK